MMKFLMHTAFAALMLLPAGAAFAGTVEATRTLRSGTIIYPADVRQAYGEPQRREIEDVEQAIGMQVRSSIREGGASA